VAAVPALRGRPRWRRKAGAAAAPVRAVAVLLAAVLGASGLVRRRNPRGCPSAFARGRVPATAPALRAAAGRRLGISRHAQEDDVAEAQAALEAARLELQAAKLRAEAEEMERQSIIERRASRARQLLGEDSSPGTTLDLEALRGRLESVLSLSVAEDRVRWLMDSGKQGAQALGFEDLRSESFQKALDRLMSDVKEEERRAVMAERERELQAQKERKEREPQEAPLEPAEVNDDRSLGTRILGSLAYTLPLLDGLQFGVPLIRDLPFLAPIFGILSIPNAILNAIPFGSLIVFIIFTFLANNRDLPRLLRFNIQQAVLLDVALFIPSLLVSLASFLAGSGDAGAGEALNVIVFALLSLAIAYSVIVTLLGDDPDGLPVISDATRRGIDGPPAP